MKEREEIELNEQGKWDTFSISKEGERCVDGVGECSSLDGNFGMRRRHDDWNDDVGGCSGGEDDDEDDSSCSRSGSPAATDVRWDTRGVSKRESV
ncbi:hypothetical protein PV325_010649 [Microctonus aethiopoides]|nr:hypothetical protein PV325_010649 [Microctonus aethiopoides]